MNNDIKISNREITSVLVNLMCMKLLLTFPRSIVINSGNAAFIQGIYVTLIGIIIFWITDKVYKTKKSVLEISRMVGGGIFEKLTAVICIAVLITNLVITLRVYPESVRMVLLKNTPIMYITVLLCIAVVIGAYNGIESLCRISSLFLPIMAAVLVLFFVLLFPYFRITNFAPVFGNGVKKIFVDGIGNVSVYSDILVLNFLLPYAGDKKTAFRCGKKAIIITSVVMLTILFSLCAIMPQNVSGEFLMPVYQLTRMLKLGDFFARFEAFFEFIWAIAMMLYTSVYIYVICNIIKEAFGLSMYKPLVAPVILLCVGIAFVPKSVIQLVNAYGDVMIGLYGTAFAIPIFFGIIERIRNGRI